MTRPGDEMVNMLMGWYVLSACSHFFLLLVLLCMYVEVVQVCNLVKYVGAIFSPRRFSVNIVCTCVLWGGEGGRRGGNSPTSVLVWIGVSACASFGYFISCTI